MSKWNKFYILLIGLIVVVIGVVYSVGYGNNNLVVKTVNGVGLDTNEDAIKAETETVGEDEVKVVEIFTTPSPSPVPEGPQYIQSYITGQVKSPGVYTLEEGSRIIDLLKAAGGATEEANLDIINLSEHLEDAQHVMIFKIGEEPPETTPKPKAEQKEVTSHSEVAEISIKSSGLININTATAEELKTLPNIGDTIAGNIIKYREQSGGFKTIEDIKNVTRIGEKTFEGIKSLITVD